MTCHRRVVLSAVVALVGGLAVGCAADPRRPEPTPSSTTGGDTPAPGRDLADLGFRHAPNGFTLPDGVRITRRVDQPNVVTALFAARDGERVLDHLTQHLAAMGWTVDASGGDSLLFSHPSWDGAFTLSRDVAGLTLRRRP